MSLTTVPNPSSPNFCEVIVRKTFAETSGKTVAPSNKYIFRKTGGTGTVDPQIIFTAFVTAIDTPLTNCLSTGAAAGICTVRLMDDPTVAAKVVTGSLPGQVTTPRVPSGIVAEVKLATGQRGRGCSGRKYYEGMPVAGVSSDNGSSGALALLATLADALFASFVDANSNTWQLVTCAQSPTMSNPTLNFKTNDVTGCQVDKAVGNIKKEREKANY